MLYKELKAGDNNFEDILTIVQEKIRAKQKAALIKLQMYLGGGPKSTHRAFDNYRLKKAWIPSESFCEEMEISADKIYNSYLFTHEIMKIHNFPIIFLRGG